MRHRQTYTLRNWEVLSRATLIGTYFVVAAITGLLLVSLGMNHMYAFGRLIVCLLALMYIAIVRRLIRLNYRHAVSYLLVGFYMVLAAGIVWCWGINTPIGLLMFALVIVLAGILQTARHAIYAAIASSTLVLCIQIATVLNIHVPDTTWTSTQSSFGDVFAYCTMFGMLGLVSWLYNHEMERSLIQAEEAKLALLKQKTTLKIQVKERTAQLRQVQVEEMRQMYHFAELGQLGVTLLHDLANHLTALTLEIEDLQDKQHAETIARAQRILRYLEDIVESTRERLHGSTRKRTFNIIRQTSDAIAFLDYKAAGAGVVIEWTPPAKSWEYTGDPESLSQAIAILVNNAIDSYDGLRTVTSTLNKRRVAIIMQRDDTHIIIRIIDEGKGITKTQRKHLFKPSHSTKRSGLGLGLYIAKQTIEMQFSGTITIASSKHNTEFIITMPRNYDK